MVKIASENRSGKTLAMMHGLCIAFEFYNF